jgi:fructosamine-3-kinase
VIPLLLDDIEPRPKPVIIHGDLWSGNVGVARHTGSPVIFDPSSCYGHNEYGECVELLRGQSQAEDSVGDRVGHL